MIPFVLGETDNGYWFQWFKCYEFAQVLLLTYCTHEMHLEL